MPSRWVGPGGPMVIAPRSTSTSAGPDDDALGFAISAITSAPMIATLAIAAAIHGYRRGPRGATDVAARRAHRLGRGRDRGRVAHWQWAVRRSAALAVKSKLGPMYATITLACGHAISVTAPL